MSSNSMTKNYSPLDLFHLVMCQGDDVTTKIPGKICLRFRHITRHQQNSNISISRRSLFMPLSSSVIPLSSFLNTSLTYFFKFSFSHSSTFGSSFTDKPYILYIFSLSIHLTRVYEAAKLCQKLVKAQI